MHVYQIIHTINVAKHLAPRQLWACLCRIPPPFLNHCCSSPARLFIFIYYRYYRVQMHYRKEWLVFTYKCAIIHFLRIQESFSWASWCIIFQEKPAKNTWTQKKKKVHRTKLGYLLKFYLKKPTCKTFLIARTCVRVIHKHKIDMLRYTAQSDSVPQTLV